VEDQQTDINPGTSAIEKETRLLEFKPVSTAKLIDVMDMLLGFALKRFPLYQIQTDIKGRKKRVLSAQPESELVSSLTFSL